MKYRVRNMGLRIVSIGSSSSGNSYLVTDGRTHIVLDVGLSARAIKKGLTDSGVDPASVSAIMITHEHTDHVKSIRAMAKACPDSGIYASRGTVDNCDKFEYVPESRLNYVKSQDGFRLGDIDVRVFSLSHDAAEPVGYSFREAGSDGIGGVTVATDTGIVTDEIYDQLRDAGKIVLEANHEVNILEMGPYPYYLKRRILSDHGHLSNASAGIAAARILESRRSRCGAADGSLGEAAPEIMLAHLSTHNNTPEQAMLTVGNILRENEFSYGRDFGLDIAAREGLCECGLGEEAL
jgi:phosphoribosyl 1,2-cyclic phosphodiesterase